MHVHKNDTVIVISGNAQGKQGKVLKVFPDKDRVIIESVNIVKRHSRPTQKNPQGDRKSTRLNSSHCDCD
jgi:large subunit ribosomal protein L24